MKQVRSAMIRGRRFKVLDSTSAPRGLLGQCSCPAMIEPEIHIPIQGDTKDELAVIIHEAIHGALWDLTEDSVEETCIAISDLLWRLGWRKE